MILSQVDMNPAFICFSRKASQLIGKNVYKQILNICGFSELFREKEKYG